MTPSFHKEHRALALKGTTQHPAGCCLSLGAARRASVQNSMNCSHGSERFQAHNIAAFAQATRLASGTTRRMVRLAHPVWATANGGDPHADAHSCIESALGAHRDVIGGTGAGGAVLPQEHIWHGELRVSDDRTMRGREGPEHGGAVHSKFADHHYHRLRQRNAAGRFHAPGTALADAVADPMMILRH